MIADKNFTKRNFAP